MKSWSVSVTAAAVFKASTVLVICASNILAAAGHPLTLQEVARNRVLGQRQQQQHAKQQSHERIMTGSTSFNAPKGKITAFSLIDAETDTSITDLVNGTVFDLSTISTKEGSFYPALSINVSYIGSDIGSVQLVHQTGTVNRYHVENHAWFSLCGNSGSNFFNCSDALGIGNHTVTATPYANDFASGGAGLPYTVFFTIVSSSQNSKPATPPVPAPTPATIQTPTPPIPDKTSNQPKVPVAVFVPAPVVAPSFDDFGNVTAFAPPELLNLTLWPSYVNVTSGPDTLLVQVVFKQEDDNEITELSVQASAPEYTYSASGSCVAPRYNDIVALPTPGNNMGILIANAAAGTVACNVSMEFVQYIAHGNYSLQLYVYGFNGGTSLSGDDLANLGLPATVQVVSGQADSTPPSLLNLTLLSPTATVNVTTMSTSIDFQVVVQDPLAGLAYGYLEAMDDQGNAALAGYFGTNQYPFNTGTTQASGVPNTFNVSVAFSNLLRPGSYSLRVSMADRIYNHISYDSAELQQRGFPYAVEVVNADFDGTPPMLLDFELLSPSLVNVTLESATVDMQLLVHDQDGQSSIQQVYVQATKGRYDESSYSYSASYVADTVAGEVDTTAQPVLVNVSMEIPRYARSGRYFMDIQVSDSRGNTMMYKSDELQNQSWPFVLDVVNAIEDDTAPKLLDLVALSPTALNASDSGQAAVTFQLTTQDNGTGIVEVYLSAFHVDGTSSLYALDSSSHQKEAKMGQPVVYNVTLEAKQSTQPGRYALSVQLGDAASNYVNLDANQLAKRKFPSFIDVVNPAYDGNPPVLDDLVLLSPSRVNVTLAPATIDIQLVIRDDVSGFRDGFVELWSIRKRDFIAYDDSDANSAPSRTSYMPEDSEIYYEFNISHAAFAADSPPQVSGESSTYNVSLTIPQYVQPGLYGLQVILNDYAGNSAYMDKNTLTQKWLASEIQVDNEIKDDEAPKLLNFTALTPLTVNVTTGPAVVVFEVTAIDELSGLYYGYVGLTGPKGSYYFNYSEVAFDIPVAGKPAVFNASFTLEPSLRKGSYSIEVALMDRSFNDTYFYAKDLSVLGFPSAVVITSK